MSVYLSLGEFQKRYGVHKGTVSRRARELGYDTSQGLSPEALEAMKREFKCQESAAARVPDQVLAGDAAGALAHYGGGGSLATGRRRLSLGDDAMTARYTTREERRQAVVEGFQGVSITREERRLLIQRAAIADADDDSEVYASVYQQRLDANLQRHAVASGLVLGKEVEAAPGGGGS